MIGVTRAKTMQQRQCPFNPRISAMALSMKTARPAVRSSVSRRTVKVQAALDPTLAVGGSTVAMLALGRFVFLPYQRREVEYSQVAPSSSPKTAEATSTYFDKLQRPSTQFTTKDPAGFTIIDTLAWGAVGHAVGFLLLAAASINSAGVAVYPH